MSLKIHELPGDPGAIKKRKRIGRGEGSGWGKTSGKGHKGAQARAGASKRGVFEGGQTPLTRRLPKFGFSNVTFRTPREALRLDKLNRFDDGAVVDIKAVYEAGLIKKKTRKVKVIATGELQRKLDVKLQGFSEAARKAIEAKGGTCEIVKV